MKDVKEFTIDRARWLCAPTLGGRMSRLYRSDDRKMCCLGFYLRAAGAKVSDLGESCFPSGVSAEKCPGWLLREDGDDSEDVEALIDLNDIEVNARRREAGIRAGFARHGVKVKFVGKYPPKKK